MTSVADLEREIRKTRLRLTRLEARYFKTQAKMERYSEHERVKRAKRELSKRYPDMNFTERDERLLRLVGTLPYVPLSKEREEIGRVIAGKYA
jgi:hypothetical protein